MKRKLWLVASLSITTSILGTSAINAAEFQPAGVRALGMGGAGVASVRDTNASYWNPAAFGFFGEDNDKMKAADNNDMKDKDFGFGVDAGAGLSLNGNLASLVDTVGAIDFNTVSNAANTPALTNTKTLTDSLVLIQKLTGLNAPGTGVRILANGMGGVRVGHFGLGVQVLGEVAVTANIDTANLGLATAGGGLIAQANNLPATLNTTPVYFSPIQLTQLQTQTGLSPVQALQVDAALAANAPAGQQAALLQAATLATQSTGTIANNTSVIRYQGAIVNEVPLSYGYAINPNLSVGGSIKYIQAQVIDGTVKIFNQNSGNFQKQYKQSKETVSGFGIDLGVMYRLPTFQAGLVVRDLNSPKFKHSSGYVYQIKPQAKLGVSYIPWDTVTVELDADLTRNASSLSNYNTQYVNAGLEWDIFKAVALRVGAYQNIVQSDIGLVYTAGLGVNLWAARLDIGAAMSAKKAQFQGKSYPREARLSAALNVDF